MVEKLEKTTDLNMNYKLHKNINAGEHNGKIRIKRTQRQIQRIL